MGRQRRRYRRRNPKTLGPYIESGENLENLQTDGPVVGWFWAKSLRAKLGGRKKKKKNRGLTPLSCGPQRRKREEAEDEEQQRKTKIKITARSQEIGLITLFIGR